MGTVICPHPSRFPTASSFLSSASQSAFADIFLFQVCRHSRHLICLQLLEEYAPNHTENLQCGQMPRVADKFHPPLSSSWLKSHKRLASCEGGHWQVETCKNPCDVPLRCSHRNPLAAVRARTTSNSPRKPQKTKTGRKGKGRTPHSCAKGPDQSTEHPPHCKASFYNVSSVKTVSKTLETDTGSVRKPKTKTRRKPDSKKLRKKS